MKIVVLGGFDASLVNFRAPLLAALIASGHEVLACAPAETAGVPAELARRGIRFVPVQMDRTGLNPWSDLRTFFRLRRLFFTERPDMLLSYTVKPVIYGSLAACAAGVPRRVALITGLGAAFQTRGLKGLVFSWLATRLYRHALARCDRVIVQNRDIAEFFVRRGIVRDANRMTLVSGSGVDITHFSPTPFPSTRGPCFLLLGRLLNDKGVREYVAAAREVRADFPLARFLLVGDIDSNPAALSRRALLDLQKEGVVEHHPFVADVRPYLEQCTAYVLPSYHEGLPRSVLEAMATGRAVVTTDTIGCRDTIFGAARSEDSPAEYLTGENGLLVPVRDSHALAAALRHLIRNPTLSENLGRRGRELAEKHFDVRKITALMLDAMNLGPAAIGASSLARVTP